MLKQFYGTLLDKKLAQREPVAHNEILVALHLWYDTVCADADVGSIQSLTTLKNEIFRGMKLPVAILRPYKNNLKRPLREST